MNKKRLWLYIAAQIFMLAIVAVFIYLKGILVQGNTVLNSDVTIMTVTLMIAFVIVGLYHIYLLYILLRNIVIVEKHVWLHSLGITLVVLSGILLLSDAVLCLEIGKEYLEFDVSGEWTMLFIFAGFHILTMLLGYLLTRKKETKEIEFFEKVKCGNYQMFVGTYQIMFYSATFAITLIILILTNVFDSPLLEEYGLELTVTLSTLAILPIVTFLMYWIIKFHKVPIRNWLDEHEAQFTLKAMLIGLIVGWVFTYIGFRLTVTVLGFQTMIWLFMVFFVQIFFISSYILIAIGFDPSD